MNWADVVVNSPAIRGHQSFTYSVPEGLLLRAGHLVRVPFGPRQLSGVVLETHQRQPEFDTKPVAALLDAAPVLTPALLKLAVWISGYYHVTLAQAVRAMLPPGLQPRHEPRYSLTADLPDDEDDVDSGRPEREQIVLAALAEQPRLAVSTLRDRLIDQLNSSQIDRALASLLASGLIAREESVGPRIGALSTKAVRVVADRSALERALESTSARATRIRGALALLIERSDGEPASSGFLVEVSEIGGSTIRDALVERGLVSVETAEKRRDPLAGMELDPVPPVLLTADQADASDRIVADMASDEPATFLLHGVTGSGKTEIYIRLVTECLAAGRQAMVLVPEISLTPQTIRRFASRFPGTVAVLHSRLSEGEHFDEWRRARDGRAKVVIGSRSALFAPLPNLGVIIVDEEHESSYKQDSPPRYHARDAAVMLGQYAKVPVVLGSATPDVVSWQRAIDGRYRLISLPERVAVLESGGISPARLQVGAPLPPVEIVDLRAELREGNFGIFSSPLRKAIESTLAEGGQTILFLNRRGAATFVNCRDCGTVMTCRACDSPFTYHTIGNELVCHLCGRRRPTPAKCPNCRSARVRYFGVGTQRVEDDTRQAFPKARVLRWDQDTARSRRAHEDNLTKFVSGEADILIGTQMVAKGLDLPGVTLVGVITADTALHLPDIRSSERTFQLLTQVAGRAGRGARSGRAIVQTYSPDNYAIQAASQHDYLGFAAQELAYRRTHHYPPFSHLARLVLSASTDRAAESGARTLATQLTATIARLGLPGIDLVGPAPSFHARLRGRQRWQILVRGQATSVQSLLDNVVLTPGWVLDVDPVSML